MVAGGNGDSPGQSPRGQTPAATPQKDGSSEWEELPSELASERESVKAGRSVRTQRPPAEPTGSAAPHGSRGTAPLGGRVAWDQGSAETPPPNRPSGTLTSTLALLPS